MPLLGTGHIWLLGILLVIVLIIWGPGKLPDVGSGMGRAIREFRKASAETKAEFSKATAAETPAETDSVVTQATPGAPAPAAKVPLTAGAFAAPRPVDGGTATVPSTEHRDGEGDQTTG